MSPSPPRGPERATHGTAGALLTDYLVVHCRAVLEGDDALRRGEEAAIHGTRVAIRRVRSAVRAFRPLFDPGAAAVLDRELRWWATLLSPVRDLQVLQDRLDALVAEVDAELPVEEARRVIDDELRRDRHAHWLALEDAITGGRHAALVADLRRWCALPPWTEAADLPATSLVALVHRADTRVTRSLHRANRSGDVEQLHSARKAAKRARYAAEAAAPVLGRVAGKDVKRYVRLQTLLGEHHDSVVSAEFLRRVGAAPDGVTGRVGFVFGLLHQREQSRADATRDEARRLVSRRRRAR